MNKLDTLIRHFENFPGVGARQARRFAFHILTLPKAEAEDIATLMQTLSEDVLECTSCCSFFARNRTEELCAICNDGQRDFSKLLVVERDADIQTVERAGVYEGLYFVLGGTVPLLESRENTKLRGGRLKALVETRIKEGLKEIILAFAVNPDGENTSRFVESILRDIPLPQTIKISYLGRGLSTGSELEYADPETIKNALQNRV